MPSIVESLSKEHEQELYGQVVNLFKRARTDRLNVKPFFDEIFDEVEPAYITLSKEKLSTVAIAQEAYEYYLVLAGLGWYLKALFKEFSSSSNTYLADMLLPLLILDMRLLNIPTSYLTYYLVSTVLVLLVPLYSEEQKN